MPKPPPATTKAQQREMTRAKLITIAREIFARDGYTHTATEDIVNTAGVTRGALYHHFTNKDDLFRAVVEDIQAEIAGRIVEESEKAPDSWAELIAGCNAFLASSIDPKVQRIMLIDAPAVLGWEVWRKLDSEYGTRLLREILDVLQRQGAIQPRSMEALVHLLTGAMNEASLWIAQSPQPEQALVEAQAELETLLNALRVG